ncbi:MAG: hypothetical protein FJ034_02610 [Chloroflexi bacterium]|nr:hypothetical protein [Chloroflexota bacterium]
MTAAAARASRSWIWVALAVSAVIAVLASVFASSDPDGLERVAEDTGFLERAQGALYEILPDYTIPGVEGTPSTALAGIAGIALVFVLMLALSRVLARRR